MKEAAVEKYLCGRVAALGGVAEKTVSLSGRGYFDRTVVLPGGRVVFCEIKKPKGGRLAIHQRQRQITYAALGAEAVVLKSFEDVDRLLARLKTGD